MVSISCTSIYTWWFDAGERGDSPKHKPLYYKSGSKIIGISHNFTGSILKINKSIMSMHGDEVIADYMSGDIG